MSYEPPRLVVQGTVASLTLGDTHLVPQSYNSNCRWNYTHRTYKQTGTSDHVLGSPSGKSVANCSV
jgi:hypothetical protein